MNVEVLMTGVVTKTIEDLPIACDMNAVTPEQQDFWVKEIVPNLYGAVEEIAELPDGYAWRLPSSPQILRLAAEELDIERLCCPFLHLSLEIEQAQGPFWLHLTGAEGAKAFVRMAIESSGAFDPGVLQAAGLDNEASPNIDSVETAAEVVDTLNTRYAREAGSETPRTQGAG
ncbi:MAG: hypothetical protein ACRDG7_16525 [Candidatus Limnocylindria bacterium]